MNWIHASTRTDFAPWSSSPDRNLRRAFVYGNRIQASKVDCDTTRLIGTPGKACVATAADSELDRADAVKLIGLDKVGNNSDDIRRALGTNDAGRFDLAFLSWKITVEGLCILLAFRQKYFAAQSLQKTRNELLHSGPDDEREGSLSFVTVRYCRERVPIVTEV